MSHLNWLSLSHKHLSLTAAHRVTSKYKLLAGLPRRQETDRSQTEQVKSVPCGQTLEDGDDGKNEKELSPALVRYEETTYFFLKFKETFLITQVQKVSSGIKHAGCTTT